MEGWLHDSLRHPDSHNPNLDMLSHLKNNLYQDHGDEKEIELLRRMEAELYILSEESSLMNERNLKFIKM